LSMRRLFGLRLTNVVPGWAEHLRSWRASDNRPRARTTTTRPLSDRRRRGRRGWSAIALAEVTHASSASSELRRLGTLVSDSNAAHGADGATVIRAMDSIGRIIRPLLVRLGDVFGTWGAWGHSAAWRACRNSAIDELRLLGWRIGLLVLLRLLRVCL
jgi:hypothetical protein